MDDYGNDHEALAKYIRGFQNDTVSVQLTEVCRFGDSFHVDKSTITDVRKLKTHLDKEVSPELIIRVLSVSRINEQLIKLLGSKYQMDYELWTAQFQTSDREWFAGPLIERGAKQFSHFNLSCVDFTRATSDTPSEYQKNRKLSHTVRLMRLLNVENDPHTNTKRLCAGTGAGIRVFAIRKISGHIRRDKNLWTFIYLCYPFVDLEAAHLVPDIPGNVQPHLTAWISSFLNQDSPRALLDDLGKDGFGFVLRVLREVKTTWKLLLHEMETFLELLNDEVDDDGLMDSAAWLHRHFILNLDYAQRQLLYHQRYVTYLMNAPSQDGLCIAPSVFGRDLLQENNALLVVDQRLSALRTRVSAVLDTVVNLNSVKQARLAQEITRLQRKDAALTFSQGQSIRRLTILNMIYLPATFISTVYGMNLVEEQGGWSLSSFLVISICLTALTLLFATFRVEVAGRPMMNGADATDAGLGTSSFPRSHLWQLITSLRIVKVKVEEKRSQSAV